MPTVTIKGLLGERLLLDWKIAVATIVSTLLLTMDAYHRFTPSKSLDRLILYLAVPMLVVVFVFREAPGRYGFGLGDWRVGVGLTCVGMIVVAPALWLTAHSTTMHDYYAQQAGGLPWNTMLDLFGWEFLFRGFLLFTYTRKLGVDGLWLQAVPFALAHIGKPEIEVLSTIFGGFVFGWMAYRTRSFAYPFLLHWFVASFTILAAAGSLA
jgi:membrane protease YdiL (CAAX protease family)